MTTINSVSSYAYTTNNALRNNGVYVYRKLLLHKFNELYKEMFFNYYMNDENTTSEERENFNKIEGIYIKVKGEGNEATNYIPLKSLYKFDKEVPSLYTYPERNLIHTDVNKGKNKDWNETFSETDTGRTVDFLTNGKLLLKGHVIDLKTKVYDIKKKYPNELMGIKFSTAVKEKIKLQPSSFPCADGGNGNDICLYIVLNNSDYEIICGGVYNYNGTHKLIIPPYAIKNLGIMCYHSQCSQCSGCSEGNCVVYRIDLLQCKYYRKDENGIWVLIGTGESNFETFVQLVKNIVSNQLADFYFVKKVELNKLSDEDFHYTLEHNDVDTEKGKLHSPFGSVYFDNKGKKITREYFAVPILWHTAINTLYFLPIMFNNNIVDICKYFQLTYNYFMSKDVFMTLTKDSEIKSYISFDKVYNNDELLLGSVEIPNENFIPSYTSTLNINEDCQRGIADIRHDKLINDNHQRIKFDEICNQTNREKLTTQGEFVVGG